MVILTRVNKNYKTNFDYVYFIYLVIKIKNFILYYYDDLYYEFKKFKDYYKMYTYDDNKLKVIQYFNYSGERHREDGPAWIVYYKNSEIKYKLYFLNYETYSYEDYLLYINK